MRHDTPGVHDVFAERGLPRVAEALDGCTQPDEPRSSRAPWNGDEFVPGIPRANSKRGETPDPKSVYIPRIAVIKHRTTRNV